VDRLFDEKTCWRMHERADAALLVDAHDYYRAFYEAASRAKRSVLLLGWQFDSDVQLLRGEDLPPGANPKDYELLPLLDRICRERPELEIRMLAWDHSLFFALEREVLQKIVFDIATPDRFKFKFDGTVPFGGSHHQKVAIIDGRIAFMGSGDICQDRWDTSAHLGRDPDRLGRSGECHKPYHEVQAVFTGAPARSLVDLFTMRWSYATGEELDPASLIDDTAPRDGGIDLPVTLPLPRADVALSRTVPEGPGRELVHEIRDLYVRAIRDARELIYIETQYLTSCCVRDALVKRMRDASKPKLDVVIVIPNKPEKFKEEFTVGHPQAHVLEAVKRTAAEHGHALGVYNVATPDATCALARYVYIHSKLMIVDDQFFTMGSANLANRSMTLDSEINASWHARRGDHALRNAIRRVRVRLLLEHLGEGADLRAVVAKKGLVRRLDELAAAGTTRLRRHDVEHAELSIFAKAVQELACDYVDPPDARASIPPPSSMGEAALAEVVGEVTATAIESELGTPETNADMPGRALGGAESAPPSSRHAA